MKTEIELLRESQQLIFTSPSQLMERENTSHDVAKASISAIAEFLSYFGSIGDYENWELQLKLLKKTYCLSDDYMKILIGMRLKGKASEWF